MDLKSIQISIVIPVLNEEAHIGKLLLHLLKDSHQNHIKEIIVVDGGSNDYTRKVVSKFDVTLLSSQKGRAAQMNTGAARASGNILYFLHADTFPPKNFGEHIAQAVGNNHEAGCFRMHFDSDSRFLKFFAWFSRINYTICRGGDQSLFVTKALFWNSNGFDEKYRVYEDNEFTARLYGKTDFKIMSQYVRTSARKYSKIGMLRLQYHFGILHLIKFLGAGPEKLFRYYQRKIAV